MIVATWNVNSIRARLQRVTDWMAANRPDVLCLQETKVPDDLFPAEAFQKLGYQVAMHGQKGYNGVAILSTSPLEDVRVGFDGDPEADHEARLIGATTGGVRVFSIYAPNGQMVGSPAYEVKLGWMKRLRALLDRRHTPEDHVVLCGDFNIAPEEIDVCDPEFWKMQVLFHPTARAALQRLCEFGLVDTFRLHHHEGGLYSWWDYQRLAFPRNQGLRIDLVLASRALAARCTAASIDRQARKGPGPSDHTVVLAEFEV